MHITKDKWDHTWNLVKKIVDVIWLLMANPGLNLRMSRQLICRGTCIIATWSDLANRWIYRRQILGDLPSYVISNLMLSVTSLLLVNLLLLTTIFSFISVKDNWMGNRTGDIFTGETFNRIKAQPVCTVPEKYCSRYAYLNTKLYHHLYFY